jgi:hypothetical protein
MTTRRYDVDVSRTEARPQSDICVLPRFKNNFEKPGINRRTHQSCSRRSRSEPDPMFEPQCPALAKVDQNPLTASATSLRRK